MNGWQGKTIMYLSNRTVLQKANDFILERDSDGIWNKIDKLKCRGKSIMIY